MTVPFYLLLNQWAKKSVFYNCLKLVEQYETAAPILAPVKRKNKRRNGRRQWSNRNDEIYQRNRWFLFRSFAYC